MNHKIPGIYIMWCKPKINRGRSIMDPYEVALFAISALAYHAATGAPSILYTDSAGEKFYKKNGVLWAWNKIDTNIIEQFNQNFCDFPPSSYENAAKVYILARHSLPYLYIDNDAVLYQNIPMELSQLDLVYAHRETYEGLDTKSHIYTQARQFYPEKEMYSTPPGYKFNPDFDWDNSIIMNTCLLYLNNDQLQTKFRNEFDRFIRGNGPAKSREYRRAQYLFLDQRLMGLVLSTGKFNTTSFLPGAWSLASNSRMLPDQLRGNYPTITLFHHLWILKHVMNKLPSIQLKYLSELATSLQGLGIDKEIRRVLENTGFNLNQEIHP